MKVTSETNIENLKRRIGLKIVELADDIGALDESGTHEVNICIRNFRKAAAEWVYDLLKKSTEYYASETRPFGQSSPRFAFVLAHTEEDWAGILFNEVVEKHIGP